MAPAPAAPSGKKGIDFKHPGGKEALIAGGVALGLALLYFWYKNRQSSQAAAANTAAAGTLSPTAMFMSWVHDHSSSSTVNGAGVKVPNVVGMTDTAADATITALGLKVKDANEPTGGFGDNGTNKVTGQSPAAGTSVATGSTVTLTFADATKPKPKVTSKKGGGDKGDG